MQSSVIRTLQERGFIYQATDLEKLDHIFHTQKVTSYLGFDATGDSLHVGHLTGIMMMRHLKRLGHNPIILLGGATTLIGDPSDKEKERPILEESTIQSNLESIKKIFHTYIENPIIVNNADWLKDIKYLEFLRDIGRYFSINRMVSFEFVKNRLDNNKPLSFLEFNYMILQGYDFYHLFKNHNCTLQLGGSDQWGNILNGVDLIHKATGKEAYGLTMPLTTTSSGAKMGKTAEGKAIWLNADKTPPYEFWQYFRNVDDKDVQKCFNIFTDLPPSEVQNIITTNNINTAKRILADETTKMLHGSQALIPIHETIALVFENKNGTLESLKEVVINNADQKLFEVLTKNNIYPSNSEAKNNIKAGAVRINNTKITDPFASIKWKEDDLLSIAKKHCYRIKVVSS